MSWNITVLTPNGRRHSARYPTDTTLLQVLEQTCKKYDFKSDEYDLTHHNRTMDTSITLRFSGLPNNAMLEMSPAKKIRVESEVTLGLQLENGNRIMGTFKPNITIYEILSSLVPDQCDSSLNPVVIYMRKEIYGIDLLKETTLKSLGLTSGRAILRLIHRTPEQLKTQANVSAPLPQKIRDAEITFVTTANYRASEPKNKSIESNDTKPPANERVVKSEVENVQICNVKLPEDIVMKTDEDFVKNVTEESSSMKMEVNTPQCEIKDLQMIEESPNMDVSEEAEECTEEVVVLGERNALVFSQEMASGLPFDDLPDEFYDLSVTEVKKLFIELKKKREALENTALKTSALKNIEKNESTKMKMRKNEKVVLRILFPDRTVLQGTFVPIDKIQVVKDFVKLYLQDEDQDFHLYITPPKQILEVETTLFDCQCIPSALLHFGPSNVDLANASDVQYLKSDILAKLSSPKAAMQSAAKARGIKNVQQISSVIYNQPENETKNTTANQSVKINQPSDAAGPSKEKNPNVPKWFKPNTK